SAKAGAATVVVPALGNLKLSVSTRDRKPEKGEAVEIGLRPEHFVEAKGKTNSFSAPTTVVEQLGGNSYLYLDVGGDTPLTVEQKGHSTVKDGDLAKVAVDPSMALLFGKDGLRI
ncbi:MAG: TOBE domain-containing protein, partial [Pseudomonadota bacterium]